MLILFVKLSRHGMLLGLDFGHSEFFNLCFAPYLIQGFGHSGDNEVSLSQLGDFCTRCFPLFLLLDEYNRDSYVAPWWFCCCKCINRSEPLCR